MCGFESELKSYDTVDRVLSCLPELIQERWYYWACDQQPYVPTLVDLSSFISNAHRVEYTRRLGNTDLSSKAVQPSSRANRPFHQDKSSKPNVFSISVAETEECAVCKAKHALAACKQFRQLPIVKRIEIVGREKVCLRCLAVGHIGKNCGRLKKCGHDGCNKLHHPLLHGAPRLYPERDIRTASDHPKDQDDAVFA